MNNISRRSLLPATVGAAGAGALAACTSGSGSTPALVSPSGPAVTAAEKKRAGNDTGCSTATTPTTRRPG